MHVTDRIKREGVCHVGGRGAEGGDISPRKMFDFRPSEIAFGAVLR